MSTQLASNKKVPRRAALLWDLDNVAPRREHLTALAQALTALVGPDAPRLAAAHRITYRSCRPILAAAGIELLSGGHRPNGADHLLLKQARELMVAGISRFLVVSNDHAFGQIAAVAELHVLTLDSTPLSTRLRDQAASLTVLVTPKGGLAGFDTLSGRHFRPWDHTERGGATVKSGTVTGHSADGIHEEAAIGPRT